jgi:hypothetical protein
MEQMVNRIITTALAGRRISQVTQTNRRAFETALVRLYDAGVPLRRLNRWQWTADWSPVYTQRLEQRRAWMELFPDETFAA